MTALFRPELMVTMTVVLFVSTQSSPVWCTIILVNAGSGIFLDSRIFVTRLAIILLTLICLDPVLYLCTSWNFMGLP